MSTKVFRKYSAFKRDKSMQTSLTNNDPDIVVINVRDYKKNQLKSKIWFISKRKKNSE